MTSESRAIAQKYNEQFEISWSTGYEVPQEILLSYGALDPQKHTVVPTMYIVQASDGLVLWSSNAARYHHTPPEELAGELENALVEAHPARPIRTRTFPSPRRKLRTPLALRTSSRR